MSYILEALNKSERERKEREVRAIDRISLSGPAASAGTRQPFLWLVLAGILITLNAGAIAMWWWRATPEGGPAQGPEEKTASEAPAWPSTANPGASPQQTARTTRAPRQPLDEQGAGSQMRPAQPPAGLAGTASPTGPAIKEAKRQTAPASSPLASRRANPIRSDATAAAKASANQDDRRPKLYEELPQEALTAFAKPSITAQVYSPENVRVRFVIGDGQLTRQGETLPNGIVVEEIREEEAWFRHGNWRFRIEMEQ